MISIKTETNDANEIAIFREALVSWFRREGKTYPWRETRDPYAVLVSELMLQQTRIATVLERRYYQRWMKAFPGWQALAQADTDQVLKLWEGLGYYNRARNLQKAAQVVCRDYNGTCPSTLDEILSLPGVGRYTAGAVLSFAFEKRAPIVDGNVVRVLARVTATTDPVDSGSVQKDLWSLAELLVPREEVREFNSGLMELGQRVCHRRNPNCEICPIRRQCRAREEGLVAEIPRKSQKTKTTEVVEHVGIGEKNGQILLTCESGNRRRGLWRLPELDPESAADLPEILRFPYAITRYRVDLRVHRFENPLQMEAFQKNNSGEMGWFRLDDQTNWPALASPYKKAIAKFLEISDDLVG